MKTNIAKNTKAMKNKMFEEYSIEQKHDPVLPFMQYSSNINLFRPKSSAHPDK